jgi:hypothetical protein
LDVLSNDVDPDGDSLSVSGVSIPLHGTATYTASYVFYTPDPDYTGADQFNYTVSDGHGGSDSATVFVTVTSANDPPVAGDDTATVSEDSSGNLLDVLGNDVDPDGDALTIVSVSIPSHGSVTTDGNYTYYTPDVNYHGADQFNYTVSDGNGGSDSALVNVTVTGVNDPPVAVDDYVSVAEDSSNNQLDVLVNDNDVDGDGLTIVSVTGLGNGSASTNGLYVFYTPDPDFNGADSFSYTVIDGMGGSDNATVFVTVTGVNDPPVAYDDVVSVVEDSVDNQLDVLVNDVDIDGDALDITNVSSPAHGSVTFTVDFVYYTPDPDYFGADQFSYSIGDGSGGSDSATVYVTVTGVNDPPVAVADAATVLEDSVNNSIDVLVNDVDVDGDNLTIVSVTAPSHGSVSTDGNYSYYSPDPDFSGIDSFSYTVSDGSGGTDTAVVSVTVTGVNDPPSAVDDYVSVPEDSVDNQLNVLLNDVDIDGDDLDITSVSQPAHGSVTFTVDFVYYTPDVNYNGSDQFNYSIGDGYGGSDSATVFVTVGGVNDPPVAVVDTATVVEDSSANLLDVLGNDVDPDGDNLTIVSVTTPSHGSVSTDGNYSYYSPDPDYVGADSFSYTISDGNGGTDTALVNVTVTGVNDPPVANDDVATVAEDSVNNQLDVLLNDVDIDGDGLTITGVSVPLHGSATFTADYVFYTPDPDYVGADSFSYTISDGNGGTDSAIVSVTVSGVNDPPSAVADAAVVLEDSSGNQIDVLVNDVDIDGDSLTIISVSIPGFGSVSTDGNYSYYSPDPDFNGIDSFSYTVSDGNGGTDTASVTVTVSAVNDPPVAVADTATVLEDSSSNQIDALLNDVDVDGDDLNVSGVTQPAHGTVTYTVDYVFYSPDTNYYGSDQFSYTITDNHGGSDSATVYVTVTPVNDPPVAVDDVATVAEDSVNNQLDVLANDNDVDGDSLTITGVTVPLHGTATFTISFVYYTPDPDYMVVLIVRRCLLRLVG